MIRGREKDGDSNSITSLGLRYIKAMTMTKNNRMTTRYNNNHDDDNNDYNNRSPGQSLGEERGERARAERGERTVREERESDSQSSVAIR